MIPAVTDTFSESTTSNGGRLIFEESRRGGMNIR